MVKNKFFTYFERARIPINVTDPMPFIETKNSALSGWNDKFLSRATVKECIAACLVETDFLCLSFDYLWQQKRCNLSRKKQFQVGVKMVKGENISYFERVMKKVDKA